MNNTMQYALAALAATALGANAQVIPGVTLNSSSSQITVVDRMAINTIDGSGLTGGGGLATDTHGAVPEDMWLTAGSIVPFGGPDYDPYIIFDLGGLYNVNTLRIWNFNETGFTKHGAKDVTVSGGATLATLTQSQNISLLQAGGTGAELAQNFASTFAGVQYLKFAINSNYDGDDFVNDLFAGSAEQFTGLSEVRFEGTAIPEPGSVSLLTTMGAALLWLRRGKRSAGRPTV
jgi:hypothetical protein